MRIKQAELEYALGREELHLLSIVEEIRALQSRLDKSLKSELANEQHSLYVMIQNGMHLSLHAVKTIVGRFSVTSRQESSGLYIDWVLDGETLFRGDRILECNGILIGAETKEDFHKMVNENEECELVVVRKRATQPNHQLLLQSQENNQRLQHRISYLEDQVKEMQHSKKDKITTPIQNGIHNTIANHKNVKGDHVTSINISSSPIKKQNEKPQIYQRGNFVATIVGGKAIQAYQPEHETTTKPRKSMHTTKTAFTDSMENQPHRRRVQYTGSQQYLIGSTSTISIANVTSSMHSADHFVSKHKDKQRDRYKENRRMLRSSIDRHNSHPTLLTDNVSTMSFSMRAKQNIYDGSKKLKIIFFFIPLSGRANGTI